MNYYKVKSKRSKLYKKALAHIEIKNKQFSNNVEALEKHVGEKFNDSQIMAASSAIYAIPVIDGFKLEDETIDISNKGWRC